MQRQSLGSPGSNPHHHSHGGVTVVNTSLTAAIESSQDSKRLSLTTPSLAFTDHDDEKTKLQKSSSLASKQKKKTREKIIHGIPILTFLCFIVLYLSSHDPSQLGTEYALWFEFLYIRFRRFVFWNLRFRRVGCVWRFQEAAADVYGVVFRYVQCRLGYISRVINHENDYKLRLTN